MLRLQEHNRIVAPNRRPQQPSSILRIARHHHPEARNVGEEHLARLAVIGRAALEISADRNAYHDGCAPCAVRPPAEVRKLVPKLHVGGPDVVEELNLDDRLEPTRSHADGPADDVRLCQRAVEDPVSAMLCLKAMRRLEDAALALHLAHIRNAAHVGHIFAEHHNARVPRHLRLKAVVDEINHRPFDARELRLRRKGLARRVNRRRVHVMQHRIGPGARCRHRRVGRGEHLGIHLRLQRRKLRLRQHAALHQLLRHRHNRVAEKVGRKLLRGTVELLAVRQRVRVGPDHMRMHHRRSLALPHIVHGPLHRRIRSKQIAAVHLLDVEVGEAGNQRADRATGRLRFNRNADGVPVVLNHVEHGQLEHAGAVQRLPELALARRAVAR